MRARGVACKVLCQGPVGAGEQAKRHHQAEEDEEEDNVGPDRADEIDEAEQAHEQKPEAYPIESAASLCKCGEMSLPLSCM